MPTGRESHDADSRRIKIPVFRVRTDSANGSLSIQQRHRMASGRKPVLQHDPGDAMLIQPRGNPMTLGTNHQTAIATAWANHDRSAVCRGSRSMHGDKRVRFFRCTFANRCRSVPQSHSLCVGRLDGRRSVIRKAGCCKQQEAKNERQFHEVVRMIVEQAARLFC